MVEERILVVSDFWPRVDNSISGIFVVQQIAAIVRLGYRVTVVVPVAVGRKRRRLCRPSDFGFNSSDIELVAAPVLRMPEALSSLPDAIRLNTLLTGIAIRKRLQKLTTGIEFTGCIIHGLRYTGFSIALWNGCSSGRKVAVVHGVDPFLAETKNQRLAFRELESMAVHSDAIALVGTPLRKYAGALGLRGSKIHIVANGTDLPAIHMVSDNQRPVSARRRIVSVSNLIPLKGVDDNLHALAAVGRRRPDLNWEYHIVGDGEYRATLEALTRKLGIGDRVRFLGRIPYTETMEEISAGDIFSLPSWGEAFGIVYLEAMSRMRPVIGCLNNGAADIITNAHDGYLVPPRDVRTLADVLDELLTSPERCSELGTAARETAERFSWDANARRVVTLLGLPEERLA